MDPRTGVRNYEFQAFEDAERPVIDRIKEVLRDADDARNATAAPKAQPHSRRKQWRAERKR